MDIIGDTMDSNCQKKQQEQQKNQNENENINSIYCFELLF